MDNEMYVIMGLTQIWRFMTSNDLLVPRYPGLCINNYNVLFSLIECMSNDTIIKIANYYEKIIPQHSLTTFKTHFRMSKLQVATIINYIGGNPLLQKKDQESQGGRDQICPEKALLITLWTLGTPDSYRSIAERFNVSKSTVHNMINVIITIILRDLCPKFIKWPQGQEKVHIANEFGSHGLQNVIGAIDGCHIPIKQPTEHSREYFNRKKFYSLVLQAVSTSDLMFIDCDVRWPGSVHDSRVLRTSDLYPIASELCGPDFYLVGDAAYPVKTWLMTPFRNNGHLTEPQSYYNKQLSKTRVCVERAFALLKGRFRRLRNQLDRYHIEDYVKTIVACCVLHNICIIEHEDDLNDYIEEGRDERHHIPMVRGQINYDEQLGYLRRDQLVRDLWNTRNQ